MDSQDTAPRPAPIERRTYSVQEAAQVLGIGRNAAYAAVRSGDIPHLRIGNRIVVPVDALDALLAGH